MMKKESRILNHSNKVRQSSKYIFDNMTNLKFSQTHFEKMCEYIHENLLNYDKFSESSGHPNSDELPFEDSLGFCFVMDTINFCFWPNSFEYDDLVSNIKNSMMTNPGVFSPEGILKMTAEEFGGIVFKGLTDNLNQIPERFRLLQEMASVVQNKYKGSYSQFVLESGYDSDCLLDMVIREIPGFQDHGVYKGKQVFFYKRAQILVGDLNEVLVMFGHTLIYKSFNTINKNRLKIPEEHLEKLSSMGEKGLKNIGNLTCFADYRVPQVLNYFKVVEYIPELQKKIETKKEIDFGSQEEAEIRGVMIELVERIKNHLEEKFSKKLMSIEVDWILWQYGEKNLDKMPNHHRVLTIFY
jgi:hypothetical protein